MNEAIAAVGLILVLEGVLYALFPDLMKRLGARIIETPGDHLRMVGLVSVALGVGVVWLVRG